MTKAKARMDREARLRWVPLDQIKVNPLAQRPVSKARVNHIAANLEIEQIGAPTLNFRGGSYYVMDGQHRIEAMRKFGFKNEQIQCWVYEELTSAQEAQKFLALNDVAPVKAFAKFKAGVHAGEPEACDIERIVRAQGLVVGDSDQAGAIGAVVALRRVYRRGPNVLARSLHIIKNAYGDAGLDAAVIDGLGHVCARYNGELNDQDAIEKLSRFNGGVNGLLNKAQVTRQATGEPKVTCVAAAAVDIINRGRGGKKLPGWWTA